MVLYYIVCLSLIVNKLSRSNTKIILEFTNYVTLTSRATLNAKRLPKGEITNYELRITNYIPYSFKFKLLVIPSQKAEYQIQFHHL